MRTEDFDYNLPPELIAQTPLEKRDNSKLMVLDKETGEVKHETFKNIINYLDKGDVLVLNDTKVLPARLIGTKEETGATIELLLLNNVLDHTWKALVKPGKRVKKGTIVTFGEGMLKAKCIEELEDGIKKFQLIYEGVLLEILDKLGTMPLPPYIHEKLQDKDRYQTIYAKNTGSVAAPTAGLHFTQELLDQIKNKGRDNFTNLCINEYNNKCSYIYHTRSNSIKVSDINDNITHIIWKNKIHDKSIIEIEKYGTYTFN